MAIFNKHFNSNSDGLLETIRRYEPIDENDEQYFIDNISKNLKGGGFLLLIVGDGIRESVEDMVESLNQTPQLFFTLSLIELQVYRFSKEEDHYIVIPQIIMRTKKITRTVIRVESSKSENGRVNIDTDLSLLTGESVKSVSKRYTITAEDYFEQLLHNTDTEQVEFGKQIIADSFEGWKLITNFLN